MPTRCSIGTSVHDADHLIDDAERGMYGLRDLLFLCLLMCTRADAVCSDSRTNEEKEEAHKARGSQFVGEQRRGPAFLCRGCQVQLEQNQIGTCLTTLIRPVCRTRRIYHRYSMVTRQASTHLMQWWAMLKHGKVWLPEELA